MEKLVYKNIIYNWHLNEALDMPVAFRSVCASYDQETLIWNNKAFHVMQFVIGGQGIFRCGGNEYKLKQGCAFFVRSGVAFEYINTGGLRSAFLSTVGSVPEAFAQTYAKGGYVFYENVDLPKYIGMISNIEREYFFTSKKARLSSLSYEVLAEFFTEKSMQVSSLGERVLTYIKRNFTGKITLADISDNVGISVSKLCHDFKKSYGCSIFTKIKNLRLDYARELILANDNLKIKDVCAFCGFDDFSYFCSAYKKRFNKSPSDDRLKI